MSSKPKTITYEKLPIDPENNPPETIEELEILISKLQCKAANIKQQLEVVTIREKQGLEVDYTRVRKSIFARAQTNKSIAALQILLKKRRQAVAVTSDNSFEKFFFCAAKDHLSADKFTAILEQTYRMIKEAESPKTSSTNS